MLFAPCKELPAFFQAFFKVFFNDKARRVTLAAVSAVSEQLALPDHTPRHPDRQDAPAHRLSSAGQDRFPLQFRHKIALCFGLLLIVVTTAFWLLFQGELNRSLQEYQDILGESLAEQTAASVRELVLVNDLLGLNVVLTQLVRNDTIRFASVQDIDDNQLSSTGSPSLPGENAHQYRADIRVQDAVAGTVTIELNSLAVATYRDRMRNLFLLVLAVGLVLVVTTAFALAGQFTAPLQQLADTLAENTDDEEDDPSGEPTQRLQAGLDSLLARYQEMEARLLETGVWQGDNEGLEEPARLSASVLVIKVVNIHTAVEVLHPATLAGLLQEYLFYLKQAARLYGGGFHRINGESVVVCFDEQQCEDSHPANALCCAGLFQSVMARINNRHRKKGEQVLDFRMAVHSGDIFMAPGIEDSAAPDAVTILGKTLDITYFLCKQGAPNELVISEATCAQARYFETFTTDREKEVSMPADNVSFMAYILANGFAEDMDKIRQQRRHILGTDKGRENRPEQQET